MTTEFDMSGKVAMVTGASSGFGVNFAKILAARGAKVVVAARRVDRLEVRHVVTLRTGRESAQRTHQQPLRCAPQQPSRGRAGIACSRCHTMWWIVIVS